MGNSERQMSALINKNYETLNNDFNNRRIFNDEDMDEQMNTVIMKKAIALSYTDINKAVVYDSITMDWYTPGDNKDNILSDKMLALLSERTIEQVRIQEVFSVKEVRIKRFLPLVTAYLLQKGIQNMDTEGKRYQETVRFAAFWVFQLYDELMDKEKQKVFIQLLDAVKEERKENGFDIDENCESVAKKVITEYVEMIKRYFIEYSRRNEAVLNAEGKWLCEQIAIKIEKIMNARMDIEEVETDES